MMATTLATMEAPVQNTALPTTSLTRGESVEDSSIHHASEPPGAKQSKHTIVEISSSQEAEKPPQKEQVPVSEATPSTVSPEARTPPIPTSKESNKAKYRATPHAKKGVATATPPSPPRNSNKFATLHSTDEEVESLIIRAQQTRKTIHPRLLGASCRDLELGGLREPEPEPPPHSQ